ncbi:hypothetical protein KIL84_012934 [Mauremys mutica]|uniref:Uncharacterized protein n=1 Tax=Mauremys mutica TaxID=74926 RepID=A0A9D4B8C4_9SAUR|nr:hypothetical protein KIL84_012934 [Mauremys mutica]
MDFTVHGCMQACILYIMATSVFFSKIFVSYGMESLNLNASCTGSSKVKLTGIVDFEALSGLSTNSKILRSFALLLSGLHNETHEKKNNRWRLHENRRKSWEKGKMHRTERESGEYKGRKILCWEGGEHS